MQKDKQLFVLTHLPTLNSENQSHLTCMFLDFPPTGRESHNSPRQTRWEHANSTQKDLESNLQPSCCDAAVQNYRHHRDDSSIQVLLTGLGVDVGPQNVSAGEVRQRETFCNPRRHRPFARAGRAHDNRAKDLVHGRHLFSLFYSATPSRTSDRRRLDTGLLFPSAFAESAQRQAEGEGRRFFSTHVYSVALRSLSSSLRGGRRRWWWRRRVRAGRMKREEEGLRWPTSTQRNSEEPRRA